MKTTKQPLHNAHVADHYFYLATTFPKTGEYLVRHYGQGSGERFFYSGLAYAKKAMKEFCKSGGAV